MRQDERVRDRLRAGREPADGGKFQERVADRPVPVPQVYVVRLQRVHLVVEAVRRALLPRVPAHYQARQPVVRVVCAVKCQLRAGHELQALARRAAHPLPALHVVI